MLPNEAPRLAPMMTPKESELLGMAIGFVIFLAIYLFNPEENFGLAFAVGMVTVIAAEAVNFIRYRSDADDIDHFEP